jgi:hypothetical protein
MACCSGRTPIGKRPGDVPDQPVRPRGRTVYPHDERFHAGIVVAPADNLRFAHRAWRRAIMQVERDMVGDHARIARREAEAAPRGSVPPASADGHDPCELSRAAVR